MDKKDVFDKIRKGINVLEPKFKEQISKALPEGAYLTSLNYTPLGSAKAKITLAGFARQTEDLLSLRTSLEQNPLFGNFHFPPSNWIRAANIDFSFDFEI